VRIGRLSRLWPSRRRRDAADCLRCNTSFLFSPGHATIAESPLLPGSFAVLPLCAACWRDLTPSERLPYYQARMVETRGPDPRENALRWAAVEAAVRTGA
jgi:hypothetical protein